MAWNLSYRCFGPTTVHLEHETYLLISLAILGYASILDIRFTALITLWLSRNLILRWMLTAHDNLTSASEKSIPFFGETYHRFQFHPIENAISFISTIALAGQTFDRPNPHVVAKFIGTNHTAADMIVENDLGSVLHASGSSSRNAHHRRGSAHGGYHHGGGAERSHADAFREWFQTTFYKLRELVPSSFAVASSEAYWTNLARSFGPSPQLLLQVTTIFFLYFCWFYPLSEDGGGFVPYFSTAYNDILQVLWDVYNIVANRNLIYYHYGRDDTTSGPLVINHALIMEPLPDGGPAMGYSGEITIDKTKTFEMYQHTYEPTWLDLSYYVVLCGTCLGILLYGRVLLPIPDLVAGSNVLSTFKEGTTVLGGGSSGGKGSRGGNHSQRGGGSGSGASGGAPIGGSSGDTHFERPWLEQYQSIITEQRLKLVLKVIFIRVVENIFLISILSRTDLACKTTGQCPRKTGIKELAKVMFHAGIISPLRADSDSYQMEGGKRPFSVGENPFKPDVLCAVMIGISVVVVTLSLLLAQAATLNRSHLGINGYLAGGWVVASVDEAKISSPTSPQKANSHNHHHKSGKSGGTSHKKSSDSHLLHKQPNAWVPRKRYKKADIVSYEGVLYKATTNNPEGKPYDFYLWMTHKLFRNELGHPATSRVIAFVSTIQFGLVSTLIFMVLSLQFLSGGSYGNNIYSNDYDIAKRTTCLLWTLAANLVAVYGTVRVAIPNYSELGALAAEITRE